MLQQEMLDNVWKTKHTKISSKQKGIEMTFRWVWEGKPVEVPTYYVPKNEQLPWAQASRASVRRTPLFWTYKMPHWIETCGERIRLLKPRINKNDKTFEMARFFGNSGNWIRMSFAINNFWLTVNLSAMKLWGYEFKGNIF